MSGASNGVIRVGRKGRKKFAFGDDGPVFEVDVVTEMFRWTEIDDTFRVPEGEPDEGLIQPGQRDAYHAAAVEFVRNLAGPEQGPITVAEALDFLARLREQYNELADFFRPRSHEKPASQDSSAVELRFSAEGS